MSLSFQELLCTVNLAWDKFWGTGLYFVLRRTVTSNEVLLGIEWDAPSCCGEQSPPCAPPGGSHNHLQMPRWAPLPCLGQRHQPREGVGGGAGRAPLEGLSGRARTAPAGIHSHCSTAGHTIPLVAGVAAPPSPQDPTPSCVSRPSPPGLPARPPRPAGCPPRPPPRPPTRPSILPPQWTAAVVAIWCSGVAASRAPSPSTRPILCRAF